MNTSPSKSLANHIAASLAAAGLFAITPSAQAATKTWLTTGTQDWATAANWNASGVPVAGDLVFVNQTSDSTFPILSSGAQVTGDLYVAAFSANPSRLDITGGSLSTYAFVVGPDNGSVATVNQSAGSVTVNNLGTIRTLNIGRASGSQGTYNLSGTGAITVNVSVNIGGGGAAGDGTATGVFNMSGGTMDTTTWFSIGESGASGSGTFNLSGGIVNAATGVGVSTNLGDRDGATGTLNVSGGTFNSTAGGFQIGNHWTGTGTSTGTINVSGTGIVNAGTSILGLKLGVSAAAAGTVNLDGGTIQTSIVQSGAGTSTFNFNGGTLQATADVATFMIGLTAANVKAGGAVFDTNSHEVFVAQALVADLVSTGGGLLKIGAGTLTLNSDNTYTGATIINDGTLALSGSITSTTLAFNLTDSTAGQMAILNPGFSFSGSLSLGLASLTASNSWILFAGSEFDSSDLDLLSGVTSDLGSFNNAGGGAWTFADGSGNWSFNDNTGTLTFAAVPEPGSCALAAVGLFFLVTTAARRRHARG